jgi:YVTN family beta-propeller protein
MKQIKLVFASCFLIAAMVSCSDNDNDYEPKGDYENGILISGEGGSLASGSVTYISNDFADVEHQIYSKVNSGSELGIYLQSIAFDNSRAFVVVDNKNTITVVDRYTFEELATITTGIKTPRYMVVSNGVGYVTNWGEGTYGADVDDDYIAVVDLESYTVTSTIPVGTGPERIVENNGKLYVSHKGGYSNNNIITVVDIATKTTTEIVVNDRPDEMFFNNVGNLIVLCEGVVTAYNADWSPKEGTPVSITTINTSTNTVASELIFGEGLFPSYLVEDGVNMYYNIGSKIYQLDQAATALPSTEILDTEAIYLYGIAVEQDNLYALDASFTEQSTLNVFDLSSKVKTTTIKAPLGASKIYFN